jgi:hypothetical protein
MAICIIISIIGVMASMWRINVSIIMLMAIIIIMSIISMK